MNDYVLNLGVAKGIQGIGTFGLGSSNYAREERDHAFIGFLRQETPCQRHRDGA